MNAQRLTPSPTSPRPESAFAIVTRRLPEAVDEYLRAIALAPALADAHFDLARVYERVGDAGAARRHLVLYRGLTERS